MPKTRKVVFMSIRHKKTTFFLDMAETSTVLKLKKVIQGITKLSTDDFALMNGNKMLKERWTLTESGLQDSQVTDPAQLKLVYHDGVVWEVKEEIIEYSVEPELPEGMKPTDDDAGVMTPIMEKAAMLLAETSKQDCFK